MRAFRSYAGATRTGAKVGRKRSVAASITSCLSQIVTDFTNVPEPEGYRTFRTAPMVCRRHRRICKPARVSRVTIDGPTGALRIGGQKVFPLGLSNAPPLGGTTPGGKDGLKELADAGATFIRTGRGNWGSAQLDEQLAAERAQLDAAAAHGLHCWLYLGEVPDLPARSAGQQASTREQMLSTIAGSLKNHPALGAYK